MVGDDTNSAMLAEWVVDAGFTVMIAGTLQCNMAIRQPDVLLDMLLYRGASRG